MGAAKEHRGIKAIRASIDKDTVKQDPLVFENDRLRMQNEQLKAHVASLEADLVKAKRLIFLLRHTKNELWLKFVDHQGIYLEYKRQLIAEKSLQHCYGAMILAHKLGLWK